MKQLLFCSVLFCICQTMYAQASYSVSDSLPIIQNGLQIGYNITNQSEKEVGSKGNFSRYVIVFYVTNTTGEAKIILHKPGWNLLNSDVSANIVQFDCINATGARLTAKTATIAAKQCNIIASVEDKDCSNNNKTVHNQRPVDIGYWIQPGETISNKQIMIVPLNERPNMRATITLNSNSMIGSVENSSYSNTASNYSNPSSNNTGSANMPYANAAVFYRIKNFWKSTYLNNQTGPVTCSNVMDGWRSAQWQLIPVSGTNYYLLQNRAKNNFISDEMNNPNLSSMNSQSQYSMWILEPAGDNVYKLKNVGDNTYLNVETGALRSSWVKDDAWSAKWVLEPM